MDTGVDRVRRVVLDRIHTGVWPVGSRAPSIRALAHELQVNRGIVAYVYQHLVHEGTLRASPGKGTYVSAARRPNVEGLKASARSHLDQAVWAARLAGYSEVEVMALARATIRRLFETERTRIAFVECNPLDARAIATDLEQRIGLPVAPVLVTDLHADTAKAQAAYDLIATSFNHFAEVQAALPETDVVGLHLVPATDSILKIASLQPGTRIGVVCHYGTTLDLFITTIRAYQSSIVGGALASDDDAVRALALECDVLIVSLFAHKRAAALVPNLPIVVLDLVIEPQSMEYMKSRLDELGYVLPLRTELAESPPPARRSERSRDRA